MANFTFKITYFKVCFNFFLNAACHEEKYFHETQSFDEFVNRTYRVYFSEF